ncbi:MAG: hypothetical protein QOD98_2930 [Nocardioidaceae bacterium]|nr:hypothetical protein [Nocardioidaceae bacterium]
MKEWLGTAARLLTGGVWIWAGAIKLPDPDQSVLSVRAYQLLPGDTATTVGHLLPVLEVVVGACLVLGLLTRGAALVSGLLFVAFIIGIASVWARGITIDCGCFGDGGFDPDAASRYPWEIARDVGLLALSAYLLWQGRTRLALDNLLFPERTDPALDLDLDDDDVQHSGV